jgi:hypothetical protein
MHICGTPATTLLSISLSPDQDGEVYVKNATGQPHCSITENRELQTKIHQGGRQEIEDEVLLSENLNCRQRNQPAA